VIANIVFTEISITDLTLNIGSLETKLRITFSSTVIRTFLFKNRLLFLDTVLQCSVECSTEVQ